MPTDFPPAVPLPRHVRWFAVWNWWSWKRLTLAGILAIGPLYALSIGPAMMLIERGVLRADTAEVVYRPLISVAAEFRRATGSDPLWPYMWACSKDGTRWFFRWHLIKSAFGDSLRPILSDAQTDPI